MGILRTSALTLGLLTTLAVSSCSTGGGGAGSGQQFIIACSLGCSNGTGGEQVFCSVFNTFQNSEISVVFAEPVDISSVNSSSFQVQDEEFGTTPVGTYVLDPGNPRRVIFRPDFSFSILGAPIFGLLPDTTYRVKIPGQAQGDGPPYVRSMNGALNQSRLQCSVRTDQGIVDAVPGDPVVNVQVRKVVAPGVTEFTCIGELNPEFCTSTLDVANERVFLGDPTAMPPDHSEILFIFKDLMNPATLANPMSGQSTFISVQVDADGDPLTIADRVAIGGTYTIELDLARLETRLRFRPTDGFTSAGVVPPLRFTAVNIPETVLDMTGNSVTAATGGGTLAFFTESESATAIELPVVGGEMFVNEDNHDTKRSGASWGGLGGMFPPSLSYGRGGGSGRLGELFVPTGTRVTLNTDSQDFPLPLAIPDTLDNIGAATITVTDGTFEFTSVIIESGGELLIEGSNAARLFSRGDFHILNGGVINIAGTQAPVQFSSIIDPVLELDMITGDQIYLGSGGPGAGDGGFGGTRFDASIEAPKLLAIGGVTVISPNQDGRDGGGIGGSPSIASGQGGVQHPLDFPDGLSNTDPLILDGITFDAGECIVGQVGGAGSGGGYSSDGGLGVAVAPNPVSAAPAGLPNAPADTAGGLASEVGLAAANIDNLLYSERLLQVLPNLSIDNLRGGSGGGGGGNHANNSFGNGFPGSCLQFGSIWITWIDHSGASGGGGGGALQGVSGRTVRLEGQILANGGNGSSAANSAGDPQFDYFAQPGGGGSGGAVRLQGTQVLVSNSPGRIDVSGGAGGAGVWTVSSGGDGGTGLIRIEEFLSSAPGARHLEIAPFLSPFNGVTPGNVANPDDTSVDFLSTGFWGVPRERPEAYSGATSCWMRPAGSFFTMAFDSDTGTMPDDMGWNMTVLYTPAGPTGTLIEVPFRGDDPLGPFPMGFEAAFGNLINHDQGLTMGSPVSVRFQGARATGDVSDLCDVVVDGDDAINIVSGSVTPWVSHPDELNSFAGPSPNMVRYTVVFDRSERLLINLGGDIVQGVTALRINALLD
jgi:hypothetical protein